MATDDLYDDGPDQQAAATSRAEPAKGGEGKGSGETALINSSICPGMEVGEEIVLRIKAIHDGEYEVEYAPEPEDKSEGKAEVPAGGESPEAGMGGMYD